MRLWRSSDWLGRWVAGTMLLFAVLNAYGIMAWHQDQWWNVFWPPILLALAYWHLRLGRTRRRLDEVKKLNDLWERSDDL